MWGGVGGPCGDLFAPKVVVLFCVVLVVSARRRRALWHDAQEPVEGGGEGGGEGVAGVAGEVGVGEGDVEA